MAIRETILRGHIGLVALVLPVLVRCVPLERLARLLTPPGWVRGYRGVAAERVVAMVARRLARPRMMRRRGCLRRGLVLYHFLRLRGSSAVLHFGVHPQAAGVPEPTGAAEAARLHGHCWVTLEGRDVAGEGDRGTVEVWAYGGTGVAAAGVARGGT